MSMFIVLKKVESKVWTRNKNAQSWSDRPVRRRRKAARWVLDDYPGLKSTLKEPQEHGMGKALPCFWGFWSSLVGHLRHCHRFFRVPFLWKDLGHLIPPGIGKVMGHDLGGQSLKEIRTFKHFLERSVSPPLPSSMAMITVTSVNIYWVHSVLHALWWVHDMDYLTL